MSKRYSGPNSPNRSSKKDWSKRKTAKNSSSVRVLTALAIPIFVAGALELTAGDVIPAVLEWGAALALGMAAWLIMEGRKAEDAYNERQIAKPPAIPRKLFGSILIGAAVAAVFLSNGDFGFINHLLIGGLATVLAVIAFGLDPMTAKGLEGDDAFERERVAVAIEKAEAYVQETLAAAKTLNDRKLQSRVEDMAASVRDMFRAIEDDPRDLSSSRKYLSVFLRAARDATQKFASHYSRTNDQDARREYENLLSDLENSFSQRREILMLENRTDLDIEIEVLRDRLAAAKVTT
ncbi:MAG: 5-bromo-4-chloroindolyl phosphate hydrolysis family protein [Pseudomonadota bacterium]